jgi:hypothetical protein
MRGEKVYAAVFRKQPEFADADSANFHLRVSHPATPRLMADFRCERTASFCLRSVRNR